MNPEDSALVAELQEIERERLRALVSGDVATAERLHAENFQLVTPSGTTYSKAGYLGAIKSKEIDYGSWEPVGDIAVRVSGESATLRYQAEMQMSFNRQAVRRLRLWHTDLYELRDGRWEVVWSQATAIQV